MDIFSNSLLPNKAQDVGCDITLIEIDGVERAKFEGVKSAQGDCFIKNHRAFHDLTAKGNPDLHYVIMRKQYTKSGKIITHALCYDGDNLIDRSQGVNARVDRYKHQYNGHPFPSYRILSYIYWNKDNIPSLEYILSGWLYQDGFGYNGVMKKGELPRLKGRWERAALEVL